MDIEYSIYNLITLLNFFHECVTLICQKCLNRIIKHTPFYSTYIYIWNDKVYATPVKDIKVSFMFSTCRNYNSQGIITINKKQNHLREGKRNKRKHLPTYRNFTLIKIRGTSTIISWKQKAFSSLLELTQRLEQLSINEIGTEIDERFMTMKSTARI